MEKIKIKKIQLREDEEVKLPFTIYTNKYEDKDPYVQVTLIEYEVIKELVKKYNNLEAKYEKLKEKNK